MAALIEYDIFIVITLRLIALGTFHLWHRFYSKALNAMFILRIMINVLLCIILFAVNTTH